MPLQLAPSELVAAMTRPTALVLDGTQVKLRLQAESAATGSSVHVDWLRFTLQLRNAPVPSADDLFPKPAGPVINIDELLSRERAEKISLILRELPDPDFAASVQAKELAVKVANRLGADFSVFPELRKGHDFYRFRWSIVRNDQECGWVGFLSSGDSPKQQSQGKTIHCNLFGMACTFADLNWNQRMAQLIDDTRATVTRCDLALDFFDGITGSMDRVVGDYKAGLMAMRGNKPKCNMVGDWCNGHSRSFYFGSKEAGKQTNVYDKGDQLFGVKDRTPWQRIEVRYGNKLRFLPSDMLRRPSEFFAGASDWHAAMLAEHGTTVFPESIKVKARVALESVRAEVARNIRWLIDTAAPSVALAFQHLGDEFLEIVTHKKAPGRLQKFGQSDIVTAYKNAFSHVSGSRSGGGVEPAFAH